MNTIDIRNPDRKMPVERIVFADGDDWNCQPSFISHEEGVVFFEHESDETLMEISVEDIPNLILALQRAVAEGWVPGLPKVEAPEKAPVKKAAGFAAAKAAKKNKEGVMNRETALKVIAAKLAQIEALRAETDKLASEHGFDISLGTDYDVQRAKNAVDNGWQSSSYGC